MAERKQFLVSRPIDQEVLDLLELAKATPVNDEMIKLQRVSFAFGNAPQSERITRETVQKSSQTIRLIA